ncbi:MAG TPA: glycoside hydrolase family 76 protein [Acidisarcina sp.]|nr:glycoside hydrolase family 76 protein [Acidisarcina sp.]
MKLISILLVCLVALFCSPMVPAQTSASSSKPNYTEQATLGMQALEVWYVQGTGLYQTTGWWNSANAITVLVNYSRVSGSQKYLPAIANTFTAAQTTSKNFLNDYYDDEGWWALAWIDAYDLTRNPQYLEMAATIFTDMAGGWETNTCGGGIWWSKEKHYKNAIANELFLSVAAHLANRAASAKDRSHYLAWAVKEWDWFQRSGMINAQHLVNDGLDSTHPNACVNNRQNTWSYNQGVVLGGLVELNRAHGDPALPRIAQEIAGATLAQLPDANGVLREPGGPHGGGDVPQFKGIFVRNLMALNDAFPNSTYRSFVDTNAQSIWNNARDASYHFGQHWAGPFDAANAANQSSALDAILAAAEMHSSH